MNTGSYLAVIKVVGVGGGGTNAVNRMVEAGIPGVEFMAINTDLQSLQQSLADVTVHLGTGAQRGLGADPADELEAIQARHLQIGHDGVEAEPAGPVVTPRATSLP